MIIIWYRKSVESKCNLIVWLHDLFILYSVGENIIVTTKIRNNYGAIQLFIFQYCDGSCKVIANLTFRQCL